MMGFSSLAVMANSLLLQFEGRSTALGAQQQGKKQQQQQQQERQ